MRLILERQFPKTWDMLQRFTLVRLVRSYEPYQPVRLGSRQLVAGERSCVDRWQIIEQAIRANGCTSLLDLGCAEGYFVQQAAQNTGCVSVGLDADVRRLTVARLASSLNKVKLASFLYGTIDSETLKKLPSFDAVLFLSVLHHVMYEHGVEYARTMMQEIRSRTNKCMIFDMGQSNEVEHSWSKLLPDMGSDPGLWISEFLRSCGFSSTERLADTDAYKNSVHRILFIARP